VNGDVNGIDVQRKFFEMMQAVLDGNTLNTYQHNKWQLLRRDSWVCSCSLSYGSVRPRNRKYPEAVHSKTEEPGPPADSMANADATKRQRNSLYGVLINRY